jgi:hypothetical protein
MAQKQYLDYEGLKRVIQNIDKKYAPISAIVFKGTVADIAHLPALIDQKAGWMYDVTTGGITTNDFVEGAGHLLANGENVAAVELMTGEYTVVVPTTGDDPKAKGWYEVDQVTYEDVTAELPSDANPQALGLYEYDSVGDVYVLTTDTSIEPTHVYFEQVTTYKLSQDRAVAAGKTYFTANTVMKWDILGGLFDIYDRYLEFGEEFPVDPDDGRVFLYMGETTHEFNEVTPAGTENPSDKGWYEFNAVTPAGSENPSEEGWYELVDSKFVLSEDTTVDGAKTYYEGGVTEDRVVDPLKTYYTYDIKYKEGVVYKFDETEGDWVPKSASAGDDMIPITNQEIDDLFI